MRVLTTHTIQITVNLNPGQDTREQATSFGTKLGFRLSLRLFKEQSAFESVVPRARAYHPTLKQQCAACSLCTSRSCPHRSVRGQPAALRSRVPRRDAHDTSHPRRSRERSSSSTSRKASSRPACDALSSPADRPRPKMAARSPLPAPPEVDSLLTATAVTPCTDGGADASRELERTNE